jgi:hypothetical protein
VNLVGAEVADAVARVVLPTALDLADAEVASDVAGASDADASCAVGER